MAASVLRHDALPRAGCDTVVRRGTRPARGRRSGHNEGDSDRGQAGVRIPPRPVHGPLKRLSCVVSRRPGPRCCLPPQNRPIRWGWPSIPHASRFGLDRHHRRRLPPRRSRGYGGRFDVSGTLPEALVFLVPTTMWRSTPDRRPRGTLPADSQTSAATVRRRVLSPVPRPRFLCRFTGISR